MGGFGAVVDFGLETEAVRSIQENVTYAFASYCYEDGGQLWIGGVVHTDRDRKIVRAVRSFKGIKGD